MNISDYLCLILCISSAAATGLLRYCAPTKVINGKNRFERICKTQSNVKCTAAPDRMTCYKMLKDGQIDFMVAEPEDLLMINTYDESLVVVTHQLKKFDDSLPQFDIEMIAIVKNDSDKFYTTKGKKLCYPGLETSHKAEFDYYYPSYFESWLFARQCDSSKTLLENRIASLSKHFNVSCIAGPWSLDPVIDSELKTKYKNLCALCANPSKCSEDDKYYGMNGAVTCLRQRAGDIAWISKSSYITNYISQLATEGYSLLCPDGTVSVLPKNLNNSCTWITDPRPVIIVNKNFGIHVQHLLTEDGTGKTHFSSVIHTSYKFSHLHNLQVPQDLRSYLTRFPGYYSAAVKALSTCRSNRSVRWCVVSKLEARKCESLEKYTNALGIEPNFLCITLKTRDDCINAVSNGACDVFVSKPEEEYKAKKLNVKSIIDIIRHEKDESNQIAAIVRKNSKYKTYSDLKGTKACFTGYRRAGWNAFFWTLKNESSTSKDTDVTSSYFKESCVLGLSRDNEDVPENLYSLCKQYDNKLGPEEKTFKCLMDGADVAFVNVTAAKLFASHTIVFNTNYKIVCPTEERKKANACYLTRINIGSILAHENITKVRKDDIYSMFLAIDRYFGETFDRETPMFDMYEPFEGISNVIFPDNARKFERAAKYGRYAVDLDPIEFTYSSSGYIHDRLFRANVFLVTNLLCSFFLSRIIFY